MLFQLVLAKFFKSELFLRLLKVDHVIKSCKKPIPPNLVGKFEIGLFLNFFVGHSFL